MMPTPLAAAASADGKKPVSPRDAEILAKYPPMSPGEKIGHVVGDLTKVVTADGRVYQIGKPWMTLVSTPNSGPSAQKDPSAIVAHIDEEESPSPSCPDMIVIRGLPSPDRPEGVYAKNKQGPVVMIPIHFFVELKSEDHVQVIEGEIQKRRLEPLGSETDEGPDEAEADGM